MTKMRYLSQAYVHIRDAYAPGGGSGDSNTNTNNTSSSGAGGADWWVCAGAGPRRTASIRSYLHVLTVTEVRGQGRRRRRRQSLQRHALAGGQRRRQQLAQVRPQRGDVAGQVRGELQQLARSREVGVRPQVAALQHVAVQLAHQVARLRRAGVHIFVEAGADELGDRVGVQFLLDVLDTQLQRGRRSGQSRKRSRYLHVYRRGRYVYQNSGTSETMPTRKTTFSFQDLLHCHLMTLTSSGIPSQHNHFSTME